MKIIFLILKKIFGRPGGGGIYKKVIENVGTESGVVVHTSNPSTWEAESGGAL